MATRKESERDNESLRIDAAHPAKHSRRHGSDREPLAVTSAELERHASELSEHLRRQQAALDQRESLIHSQLASLETQRRRMRAQAAERMEHSSANITRTESEQLAEQETALRDRQRTVHQREVDLSHAEERIETELADASAIHAEATRRLEEVEAREREVASQKSHETERRLAAIDEAERSLGQQYALLDAERAELQTERDEFYRSSEHLQAEFVEKQRAFEAACEQQRRQLRARAQKNERQADAQARIRHELLSMHREMLELGIALQEIWSELAERISMPALHQSLLHVRAQLADTYRLERQALAEERHQLHSLAKRLAEHKRALDDRRADLSHWVDRRNASFEAQAAQLVAKQQDLERQERRLSEERDAWVRERRDLESQYREVLTRRAA